MVVIVPGRGRCWGSPVLSDSETPTKKRENIFVYIYEWLQISKRNEEMK